MVKKVLVAYFSASGNTREIAKKIAQATHADLYEIKPLEPYTKADLNWMDKNARTTQEMQDHNSRPSVAQQELAITNYQLIFLGFPIWWYVAPTIVNSFLEQYDFANKKIVLFATSGGSGFGETIKYLKPSVADSANITAGEVFNHHSSFEQIKQWTDQILSA